MAVLVRGRDFTSEKCFGNDVTGIPGGGSQGRLGAGGAGERRGGF